MSVKKSVLAIVAVCLSVSAGMSWGQVALPPLQTESFRNPTLKLDVDGPRLWVQACTVEYGESNCSLSGNRIAANAFCEYVGYDFALEDWEVRSDRPWPGHRYYQWHIFSVNRRVVQDWRICRGCVERFKRVNCAREQPLSFDR